MLIRLGLLAVVLVGSFSLGGCARLYAGLDGNLSYSVEKEDWQDLEYGYLSVGSVPEGAVVYFKASVTIDVNFRVGLFYDEDRGKTVTSDWVTLGSTPVLNHEIARSGRAVDWKIGSRARSTFRTHSITVRVEKPGYETRVFEHVTLSDHEVTTPRLIVELTPIPEEAPEEAPEKALEVYWQRLLEGSQAHAARNTAETGRGVAGIVDP